MIRIQKLLQSIQEMTEQEYSQSTAMHVRAIADYNLMMGILEDPNEEEEDEEDE